MDPKLVTDLLSAVLLALVGILAYTARQFVGLGILYLRSKIGDSQFDQVMKQAETTVRYLEQSPVFENLEGAKKFELLKIDLLKFCEGKGIPLADADLDKIGEAAVRVVKKEIGTVDWGTLDAQMDETLGKAIDAVTGYVGE